MDYGLKKIARSKKTLYEPYIWTEESLKLEVLVCELDGVFPRVMVNEIWWECDATLVPPQFLMFRVQTLVHIP